jgi:hypothetical protein
MSTLKSIVYPFGMAFLALILVNLAGIAAFGPDSQLWLEWQNRVLSWIAGIAGVVGFIAGVYLAAKSNARLIP